MAAVGGSGCACHHALAAPNRPSAPRPAISKKLSRPSPTESTVNPDAVRVSGRRQAGLIALAYVAVAALWIYFSDRALLALLDDPGQVLRWSVYKGWLFVAFTALMLFLLMQRALLVIERSYASLAALDQQRRLSEAQLEAILEDASDAILVVTADGQIVRRNAAAERLLSDRVGADIGRWMEAASGSTEHARQWPAVAADGRACVLEVSMSGTGIGPRALHTLIVRDVSSRVAFEAEIARQNRLYAALSQINQAVLQAGDLDILLPRVCQALVEQGGFRLAWVSRFDPGSGRLRPLASAGEDAGELTALVVYPDERPEGRGPTGLAFRRNQAAVCNDIAADPALAPWQPVAAGLGIQASAAVPVHRRGQAYGALTVCASEREVFGPKEIALLGEVAHDISYAIDNLLLEDERRQAQLRAQSEKQFSDTMIESMPGIVYFYDINGRFLRWNRNFELMSGYTGSEISTMHPLEFFSAQDKPLLEQRIGEVFERGESAVEAYFLAKDGRRTPYFFTGRRVVYEQTTCLVGVGIDISERMRAEWALRELNENLELMVARRTDEMRAAVLRAEAADRTKSAFLASMSHELRTPLNSIIGFSGILLQGLAGPLNAEQSKQLGMVLGSARHLLELINDVLDISKIEAGQFEVRSELFDLPAAVERVLESVRPLAEKRGLRLWWRIEPGLEAVCSDRRRVEQILLNLLNNAIKFTDQGSVCLVAEPFRWQRPGRGAVAAVRIAVSDTGIGIREEDLPTLFQAFRQLDTGLARLHEGTGLGLAICRRLAGLLGGEISVESEWQKGSTFALVLPLERAEPK